MPIQAVNGTNINNTNKKSPKIKMNPVTLTGYGALLAGGASAIAGYNKKIKAHKYLAYIGGALALLHTGIIESYKFRHNKK